MTVNHVGLRCRDLATSIRFYEALGFELHSEMAMPDDPMHRLVMVEPPAGLRVAYLTDGPFVLELLAFGEHETGANERVMTDGGLTHLSLGVDDLAATKQVVARAGGEVLDATDVGAACMVRDPDGQLIELLDSAFRPVTP